MKTRDINLNGMERAVSALVGGLLVRSGLRRKSALGALVAAGGATLAYRGISGRSLLYRKLGVGTTRELAERGATIRKAITIGRSPEEVYSNLREIDQIPEILDRVERFERMGDGTARFRLREAGVGVDCIVRLTADEAGRRLAWETAEGSQIRCDGTIELKPAPGDRGTELHVVLTMAPPGGRATSMLAPLLRRVATHQLVGELHRFKQRIEAGEVATSAMRPERRPEIETHRRRELPERELGSEREVRP